uniref:Uncharacterized protein n=1 Tax=Taeniopygia guttata TaxID=59729 RepID=A0A674HL61_TAEGU
LKSHLILKRKRILCAKQGTNHPLIPKYKRIYTAFFLPYNSHTRQWRRQKLGV